MKTINRNFAGSYALALSKDGSIDFFDVEGFKVTCSRTAYRSGYFDGLLLFNQDRHKFRVEKAVRIPGDGLKSYFLRDITVELIVSYEGELPFQQIKNEVISHIEAHKDFWEAGGDYNLLLHALNSTKHVLDIAYALNLIET